MPSYISITLLCRQITKDPKEDGAEQNQPGPHSKGQMQQTKEPVQALGLSIHQPADAQQHGQSGSGQSAVEKPNQSLQSRAAQQLMQQRQASKQSGTVPSSGLSRQTMHR